MNTRYFFASVLLAISASVSAQTISGSYFLDGSFERNKLNPALMPERTYFSLPFLKMGFNAQSNVGLDDFLFNSVSDPDMLTTFMSSEVNAESFLKNLPDKSGLDASLDMDLFNIGFRGFGGFNYIDISLRNREQAYVPKSLFEFMKAGLSNGTYNVSDMSVSSTTYAEFAIGHARNITDNLSVGIKVKYLAGLAYVSGSIDELHACLGDEEWRVRTNAVIRGAVGGSKIGYTIDSDGSVDDFDTDDLSFEGLCGTGFGLDLGAVYDMNDIVKGLTLSASLTDIGSITWKNVQVFETDDSREVVFQGFNNYDITSDDNNVIDDTMDKLSDDFEDMCKFYASESDKYSSSIGATLRLGAERTMSFASWLSAGELFTYRLGDFRYAESRTSVNAEPCEWFDASANIGISTFGTSFGWIVNLHPAGFNIFIGSDGMKYTKDQSDTPVGKFNANLVFGINIPVGKRI